MGVVLDLDMLTPEETAERLRLSVKVLAKWRSAGDGPKFYKLGSRVRYRACDVAEWIGLPELAQSA